jgi:hypothetical protein
VELIFGCQPDQRLAPGRARDQEKARLFDTGIIRIYRTGDKAMASYIISAAEAARSFPALLERVRRERISVTIERDGDVMACLEPAAPPEGPIGSELDRLLAEASFPHLGADEAAAFEADIAAARQELAESRRTWD